MQMWRHGLLLFLIFPVVFAATPIDLTFAVPAIAVIVGIFLALSSMLATAISDPRLEAWVKIELRELAVALIVIGAITVFFIGSSGISIALTGTADYVTESQEILDSWIERYDSSFEYIIKAATRLRTAATYSPYLSIPLWFVSLSYSTNPLAGVAILLGTLNQAAQGLTNAIFISEGIRMLIAFLKVTVPKILLPLSFVIRLIPFTRRLGNTLIAISIAGILFLPFSVIVAGSLNGTINVPNPRMNLNELDANPWAMTVIEPFCEAAPIRFILSLNDLLFSIVVCLPLLLIPIVGPGLYAVCQPLVQYVVYPLIMVIFQVINTTLLIAWESVYEAGGDTAYANAVFDQVQPFLRDVNNLVLVGYLDFILIAVITIVGARSLSAALGGEWYMAGIQRLI